MFTQHGKTYALLFTMTNQEDNYYSLILITIYKTILLSSW